jgi:hypothetical protein
MSIKKQYLFNNRTDFIELKEKKIFKCNSSLTMTLIFFASDYGNEGSIGNGKDIICYIKFNVTSSVNDTSAYRI